MKEGLGSNKFEVVQHPESKITVIGSGPTGDKAARLLEYTLLAREIGFLTPQRTVIAQDVVDSWIRAAKIGKGIERNFFGRLREFPGVTLQQQEVSG